MGFVTPLFIVYVIEARAKLAFARARWGEVQRARQRALLATAGSSEGTASALAVLFRTGLRRSIEDSALEVRSTCLLIWLNLMLIANILTVTAISAVHGSEGLRA